MRPDLFAGHEPDVAIGPGAVLLKGFADGRAGLGEGVAEVAARAPFRRMVTARGFRMSVAMTSCGKWGWVSDRAGYRYDVLDPETGRPWPAMPGAFRALAQAAAARAGYPGFMPDACLVNRYETGTRLSLHQDRDEKDLGAPIVSVSLGVPATFVFGGTERGDPKKKILLEHGDVVVWGGPSRLAYHGILPLKPAAHPFLGAARVNLTFRRTH